MGLRNLYPMALGVVVLLSNGCASRHDTPTLHGGHFADPEAVARRQYDELATRAAREPGAIRMQSGLVYREVTPGSGASPGPHDSATVRYEAKDGEGNAVTGAAQPRTIVMSNVDPCIREALLRMRVGGTSRFLCPLENKTSRPNGSYLNVTPTFLEATLVAVGEPLPPPGH